MVMVECLGQKTYTSAKEKVGGIGETTYGEHLFLEPKSIEKEAAEDGKIVIKLLDKGMFKDVMIGLFEFDLSFVYLKKDHVLLHKWLGLNNPKGEDYATVQAYLKVSVSVSCSDDE